MLSDGGKGARGGRAIVPKETGEELLSKQRIKTPYTGNFKKVFVDKRRENPTIPTAEFCKRFPRPGGKLVNESTARTWFTQARLRVRVPRKTKAVIRQDPSLPSENKKPADLAKSTEKVFHVHPGATLNFYEGKPCP